MEQTTMKKLIDFNDKLIAENGETLTAYEILQKVIRKAAELIEEEKTIIADAFNEGYRASNYDRGTSNTMSKISVMLLRVADNVLAIFSCRKTRTKLSK